MSKNNPLKDRLQAAASNSTNKAVNNMIVSKTQNRTIEYIDPKLLLDHPSQADIFQLPSKEKYDEMVESIKNYGIIEPLLVRKIDAGIEIIAGHTRRYIAVNEANLDTVPVIFGEFNDDEAELILIGTNKWQRDYDEVTVRKMTLRQIDVMKRLKDQGQDIGKGKIANIVADQLGISARKVEMIQRVERSLIEPLKALLDKAELTSQKAYEISALDEEAQWILYRAFDKSLNSMTGEKIKELKESMESSEKQLRADLNALGEEKLKMADNLKKLEQEKSNAETLASGKESEISRLNNEIEQMSTSLKDVDDKIKKAIEASNQKIIVLEKKLKDKDDDLLKIENKYKQELGLLKGQLAESKSAKILTNSEIQTISELVNSEDSSSALEQIWEIILSAREFTI